MNCNEGRLELCESGFWGTVCDDGWNEGNSKVVCNSLGISGGKNSVSCMIVVSRLCIRTLSLIA